MKSFSFSFIFAASLWLGAVDLTLAQGPGLDYCGGVKEEVKKEIAEVMKSCFKSLNIDPSDEHRKGVETSFDDKGVTLCAFTQMKMAKEDGTIDKDKLLAFLKIEDAEFPKLVESCSTKAESEFKDESDAAVKAKKKTTYFVVCLDREFCKDKKPPKM